MKDRAFLLPAALPAAMGLSTCQAIPDHWLQRNGLSGLSALSHAAPQPAEKPSRGIPHKSSAPVETSQEPFPLMNGGRPAATA